MEEGSTVTTFAQFGQNNMTRPTTRQPEEKSNRENRYAGQEDSNVQNRTRNYKLALSVRGL